MRIFRPDKYRAEKLCDAAATAEVIFSIGQSECRAIRDGLSTKEKADFGAQLVTAVFLSWWSHTNSTPIYRAPIVPPAKGFPGLVERLSSALLALQVDRAGFLLGQLYTALLPEETRKGLGAYYTPPDLAERLADMVTASGFDWRRGRILDPACGGAAFLSVIAKRILSAQPTRMSASDRLADLQNRLTGIEIDPFAAWLAMALLDVLLLPLSREAGYPVGNLVRAQSAFDIEPNADYDLVIGNPPYGKTTLSNSLRNRFRASLFGHANLYGLFTELGIHFAKPGGLVAFVTPTSVLGGEYFKNLRKLLSDAAPLQRLDFVAERDGVFDNVLQETMLTVFGKLPQGIVRCVHVNRLEVNPNSPPAVKEVGSAVPPKTSGEAWVLPRRREDVELVARLAKMPQRLRDFGFAVSTGQLVWNRHKPQLRTKFERGCHPIIWAEAVTPDGAFVFQAARRTHLPYLRIERGQEWLVNSEPCLLIQRTTAKEQRRRLIVALIPNSFVCEYPGFVVENHLNMIYPTTPKNPISLQTLRVLLASSTLDRAFRCINGSVAVSAYELNSLPLPSLDEMRQLQDMVLDRAPLADIEHVIASFYGIAESITIAGSHSGKRDRKVAA